jgi:hypothetical protein
MAQIIDKIMGLFQTKALAPEAIHAYYNRLPQRIRVSWQRDGQYIIGTVSDGKNEFVTQGRNADEFIEMVNDAVLAVYDIPSEYIDALRRIKTYNPPAEERIKLGDLSVMSSVFGNAKNDAVLKLT